MSSPDTTEQFHHGEEFWGHPKAHQRTWQERIQEYSKITDRSARDRCLYGN